MVRFNSTGTATGRKVLIMDAHPVTTTLSTCTDCGTQTFCNVAHGAGHDHSPEAVACTVATLARGDI